MPHPIRLLAPVLALALLVPAAPSAFGWDTCPPTTRAVVSAPVVAPVRYVPASAAVVPVSAPVAPAPIDESPVRWKTVNGIRAGARPLLVWIADPTADAAVETRAFEDGSVRLASRAFRTVRIAPEAAKRDAYLSKYAALAPALVVYSPSLERATVTVGPALDATGTLDAMRRAAKDDLGMDLDAAVARARTLLADRKAVEDLQAKLDRTAPRDADRVKESDRRLQAIRAELETVLRPPPPSAATGLASR